MKQKDKLILLQSASWPLYLAPSKKKGETIFFSEKCPFDNLPLEMVFYTFCSFQLKPAVVCSVTIARIETPIIAERSQPFFLCNATRKDTKGREARAEGIPGKARVTACDRLNLPQIIALLRDKGKKSPKADLKLPFLSKRQEDGKDSQVWMEVHVTSEWLEWNCSTVEYLRFHNAVNSRDQETP